MAFVLFGAKSMSLSGFIASGVSALDFRGVGDRHRTSGLVDRDLSVRWKKKSSQHLDCISELVRVDVDVALCRGDVAVACKFG